MQWLNRLIGKSLSALGLDISFLISFPMVDLGSLVLLSIFGWKIAAAYVSPGLMIAVTGGTIIEKFRPEDPLEGDARSDVELLQEGLSCLERM